MADGKGNKQVEKYLHCPECGAGHKLLTRQYDGSFLCLRCNHEWYPKPRFSIREEGAPYLGRRVRAFLDMLRPFTLIGAGLAGFFLVLLSSILAGVEFSWILGFGAGLILATLHGGLQALNSSNREEIKLDRENEKAYRPAVKGVVAPSEGKLWGFALLGTGIGFAFALGIGFGLFAIVMGLFGYFYTYEPIRAKSRFLVNNFWQSTARGALPFLAVCYGLFETGSYIPFGLALFAGILLASLQTTKDFPDISGDREFGIQSLPVKLGEKGAIRAMAVIAVSAFGMLAGLILMGVLPGSFTWLSLLAVPTGLTIYSLEKGGSTEYRYLENSVEWAFGFYGTVALIYILPSFLLM